MAIGTIVTTECAVACVSESEKRVGGSDPGGGREQPPFGCGFRDAARRTDPPVSVVRKDGKMTLRS